MKGCIIIVTGCPGTGKSTVASLLAQNTDAERSVHMHTDDFYHFLAKGAVPLYLPGADEQNLVVIEAFLEAAKRFVRGGYEVIVDGVVGPWFLRPWLKAAEEGYEIHYIVLRADRETTVSRAIAREKLGRTTNAEIVNIMWPQFTDLGEYEKNSIETTDLTAEETAKAVRAEIGKKTCRL